MKQLAVLILFMFLISITSAISPATFSSSLTVIGASDAVVMGHAERTWGSGTDVSNPTSPLYTGGASGHQILTAPGPVKYQQINTLDASESNYYTSSGFIDAKNGVVTRDSIAIDESAPNQTDLSCTASNVGVAGKGVIEGNVANKQYAVGERTAIGQSMNISTDKYVNDADIAISGDANWTGSGSYKIKFDAGSLTGATKNSTVPSYTDDAHDSYNIITGANNTGMRVIYQNARGDFSKAFVAETANQTNSNTSTQEEPVDEPVNETGEEA